MFKEEIQNRQIVSIAGSEKCNNTLFTIQDGHR